MIHQNFDVELIFFLKLQSNFENTLNSVVLTCLPNTVSKIIVDLSHVFSFFPKVVNCTSWFQFADRIETKIRAEQTFTLMKFYPFLPVNFHMSLAAALVPKLSYSNSALEVILTSSVFEISFLSTVCSIF